MAFQQAQQRPQPVALSRQVVEQAPLSPTRKRSLEESQEWILFSPTLNEDGQSSQAATSQTPRTATQLSEFGSLETRVLSQRAGESSLEGNLTHLESEIDDDDAAELDSLDDGLHAFHQPFSASSSNPLDQSGGAVLPTHDGMGTFPSPAGLQEHLWQFERHNPQRKRSSQRRSSIQQKLDGMEEEEVDAEDERTARIEKWRLDQSRAVLEEIERETRRRRRRMSRTSGRSTSADLRSEMQDSLAARAASRIDSTITEEPEISKSGEVQTNESFWQRITRRVIQDLIGLDENTLSVIFGEQLAEDPSPTPTQPSPITVAAAQESRVSFRDPSQGWEAKLLDRVARELGILLHQFSEHEGAFSTYLRTQQTPDYAGIPTPQPSQRQTSIRQRPQRQNDATTAPADSLFEPTIPQAPLTEPSDASVWGIEKEPTQAEEEAAAKLRQQQEYWEREVDVKMIFSYLKSRFSSSDTSAPRPSSADGPLPAAWATSIASALGNTPESLRRAEVIRKQHPLVSRAAERAAMQTTRRESFLRRHHMQNLMQKRPSSSSCASQSTKRSRHSRSGSSRHYWDLGGSVESGSGPALSSGISGWGEV